MAREAAKGYAASETYLRCLIVAAMESKRRGVRAVDEAHEAVPAGARRERAADARAAVH